MEKYCFMQRQQENLKILVNKNHIEVLNLFFASSLTIQLSCWVNGYSENAFLKLSELK